jgi:predicted metal-dependent peptidase
MLEASDKIIKAKVQLQKDMPFFAYILLHLKAKEDNTIPSMAVDYRKNLLYNKEFVSKLSDDETEFVLCHEAMHIALNHFLRKDNRDVEVWNVATDLVINEMLLRYFSLQNIRKNIITVENLEKMGIKIKNVDEKTAEEVYDILINYKDKLKGFTNFDIHYYIDDLSENEKEQLQREYGKSFEEIKKEIENENKRILVEATNFGKMRGNLPSGIERVVDKLLSKKIDWKTLLRRTISDMIPYDFSYKYPSKKSIAIGIYLPATIKDKKLEVVCVVDLSGSISDEEMRQFFTEIYHIAKSFHNVDMTIITHDAEKQDEIKVRNGCIDKLLNIKVHGGGGTSHLWLPEYLKKKHPNSKLIVCFTDGYTEFFDKEEIGNREIIWILSEKGVDEKEIPFGKVIKMVG